MMSKRSDAKRAERRASETATSVSLSVGRGNLAIIGPYVPVELSLHPVDAADPVTTAAGVPTPIRGMMLVDTGASHTCITPQVVDHLRLKPCGQAKTYAVVGVRGELSNLYRLRLKIFADSQWSQLRFSATGRQFAVVDPMDDDIKETGARMEDGSPMRGLGYLGRETLACASLNYDGIGGRFSLAFPVPEPAEAQR